MGNTARHSFQGRPRQRWQLPRQHQLSDTGTFPGHAQAVVRMKCLHRMPFGAELLDGGGVRFRLWAPGESHMDLLLGNAPVEEAAMRAQGDGWFELIVPGDRKSVV